MAHENWRQVKEIFIDALRQKPAERKEFLAHVCRDDEDLRREVESLLESLDSAESFMESPAVGEFADEVLTESKKYAAGQFLGHYEILKQIGTGGNGDVYLAQDTHLHRLVALKILHEDLQQRLLREARAVAKLNHPNICAIYEISETPDNSFIVMEYADGETLADLLAKERLSAETSLKFAIQIANALDEAHTQNVIHRDIKPANIVVNKKGQVKVLDFGLAKIIEAETDEKATAKLSSSGAIMGTVPYMSPEQLRGRRLDARTDIFSFGTVFYEMLGDISPFQNDSNAETISAILNDAPDLSRIPSALRPIVEKCLMKNKTERYQTAKDLAKDLSNVGEICPNTADIVFPSEPAKQTTSKPRYYFWKSFERYISTGEPKTLAITKSKTDDNKRLIDKTFKFWVSAFTIFIVLGAIYFIFGVKIDFLQFRKFDGSDSFDSLRPIRLVSWKTGASGLYSNYSSSHDGKMIAYSSAQDGANESIYVKQTSGGEDIRVTKDEWNNDGPIWSPDDRQIAFASSRENQSGIYVCPSLGGTPTLLKIIGNGSLLLRHWSKDSAAIFYEYDGNLFRLDIAAQETVQITNFTASQDKRRFFSISPDETETVYCDEADGQTDLWLMSLKNGTPFRLTNDKEKEVNPNWHPDGERILYTVFRDNHNQINLVHRDGRKPLQITRGDNEYEIIDVSADGTKIFYVSWEDKSDVWGVKTENGEEFDVAAAPESEFWADVSPDGKSILFQINDAPYPVSSLHDSSISVKSTTDKSIKLSFKGFNPRWLPDSRRVAFLRWQATEKKYNLWLVNVLNGEEKQITDNSVLSSGFAILPYNRLQTAEFSWSPDSSKFVYVDGRQKNIWLASPDSAEKINLTNNASLTYFCPLWSPDGKRIVYVSRQKSSESRQPPIWKVWLWEQEKLKEIFSTNESVRLLGWSASSGEVFLETTVGVMKSNPLDVKLRQVSTNGENRTIGTFKNIYVWSVSLSADGKMVAYTSRQDDKDNIFIAATNDGTAKKITANGNAKLYFGSLTWSPDGKTIFFDKQEEINTISMFENFK